jgi:hypothetical protein
MKMAATLMCGVLAGTAGAQTHPPYIDPSGLKASERCHDTYGDQIYLPEITSKHGNRYVLLLVFDNDDDAQAAGEDLFLADKKDTTKPATYSCVADPPQPSSGAAKNAPGWALVAKGGCPRDCTANDMKALDVVKSPGKSRAGDADADPLWYMTGKPHWAIFFAGTEDVTAKHPGTRVWQIQTADAVHAHEIIKSLAVKLNATQGYMGHVLIGYLKP